MLKEYIYLCITVYVGDQHLLDLCYDLTHAFDRQMQNIIDLIEHEDRDHCPTVVHNFPPIIYF